MAAVAAAAGVADCPMLRILLGRGQRDCPFSLSWMLMFNDLAVLHATCRAWQAWINTCELVVERFREVTPYVLPRMVDSVLARSRIVRIVLMPVDAELPAAEHCRLLEESMITCTRLPKLMQLQMHSAAENCSGAVLCTTFDALQSRLNMVELHVTSPHGHDLAQALLTHVGLLPKLQEITLHLHEDVSTTDLDFSQLPRLALLDTFQLPRPSNSKYYATEEQVRHLAACPALTSLDCGSWAAFGPVTNQEADSRIASGIAILAATREDGSSSPLRQVRLPNTAVTVQMWPHLVKLANLTSMWPLIGVGTGNRRVGPVGQLAPVAHAEHLPQPV